MKFRGALFIVFITNKKLMPMKIFLIWLGIILCGVINGFSYSRFNAPECYTYILVSSLICVVILIVHRKLTKNWESHDILSESCSDYHMPIFKITLFISVFFCFCLLLSNKSREWESISCITVACASFIAYLREKKYVFKWE